MQVFDTFGNPEDQIQRLLIAEPTAFNGLVRVERYRVTVERIEEPKEVIKARLQELLNQKGHIDKNKQVRRAATRLGIKLDD
jgi:predicted component of type VI protein secretion system